MAGGVLASTYLVVCGDAGIDFGIKYLQSIFDLAADGTLFKLPFGSAAMIYGLLVFLLINAILLITLALMFLLNIGMLGRVRQFYTITIWFLMGALAYTFGVGYTLYQMPGEFIDLIKGLKWYTYAPLGSAIILLALAIIFRRSEAE